METKWIIIGAIAAVILAVIVLVLVYFGMYNGIIASDQQVSNSWGQVQVQYQRRVDLIPNLVSTVSAEANFEKSTLTELTALRSQWQTATTQAQQVETANQIESTISKLLVISENYPTLTATQAYQDLMVQLEGTENRVAFARGEYNNAIKEYNLKVTLVPSSIVASMNGFTVKKYFESKAGADVVPDVGSMLN